MIGKLSKLVKNTLEKLSKLVKKSFEELDFTLYLSKYLNESEVFIIEKMQYFLNKYKKQLLKLKTKIKSTPTPNDDLYFNFALRQLKNFSQCINKVIEDIERY